MDLLQNIDIKVADTRTKRLDATAREKPSGDNESSTDKAFKQQLSEQVDQLKSTSESEKSNENQTDKDSFASNGADDADTFASSDRASTERLNARENARNDEAVNETADEDTPSSAVALQDNAISEVIAVALPVDGSDLPLSAVQEQAIEWQNLASPVVDQKSTADVNVALAVQSEILNKVMTGSIAQNVQNIPAESSATSTVSAPLNLTTTLSEKVGTQDAKLAKLLSEMPAGDMLTQTSRLLQVPVVTATSAGALSSNLYSSNLLSAQNLLSTGLAETTNTNNNAAAVNITPLSNLPATSLSGTVGLSIGINIQNANWSQQMTQQVAYMVKGGFQQAEIKLNPAHLGPMEIKLSITDDQATVNFVAQHAPVRDALDAALPRLKEMLEQQGLHLADADVSAQSEQQASAESQQDESDDAYGTESHVNSSQGESVEEHMIVNMDVKSGVSIFA